MLGKAVQKLSLDDASHRPNSPRYKGAPARQPRWGANRRLRFPASQRVGMLRIAPAAEPACPATRTAPFPHEPCALDSRAHRPAHVLNALDGDGFGVRLVVEHFNRDPAVVAALPQ